MVFFEAIQALLSLDISFFIDIVMGNILWSFMFFALIYFFFDKKNTIYYFLLWAVLLWAFFDFESLTSITFRTGPFLMIYYLTKLAVLAWAENSPRFKDKLLWVSETQFLLLLFVFTFFLK
ncbi:MAG: hypothetical protein ABIH20_02790 [Candidatus Diapherotrites archaeon]